MAFTDVNGDHRFQANTDQLIAAVVDTNRDGTVSVGDTVQFGTYPLHVDSTGGRGTFTHTSETVTGVAGADSSGVAVSVSDGSVLFDVFNVPILGHPGDTHQQFSTSGGMVIDDVIGGALNAGDISFNNSLVGPGSPDTLVSSGAIDASDNPFLDIFIA